MILLVDSGSTKADWCLTAKDGKSTYFSTSGANPHYKNSDEIAGDWEKDLSKISQKEAVEKLYFYGAGCSSELRSERVKDALNIYFSNAEIFIEHDLTAAAKALCGNNAGIATILGTGSNSCFYNGKSIQLQSGGIGLILGDEGSGADLGCRFIRLFMYNLLDEKILNDFNNTFKLNKDDIFEHVYRKAYPNRFLAEFAPFILKYRLDPLIRQEILTSFHKFFEYHIVKLKTESGLNELNSVGSIAWFFKEELNQTAKEFNFSLGKILKSPLEALKEYHFSNQ